MFVQDDTGSPPEGTVAADGERAPGRQPSVTPRRQRAFACTEPGAASAGAAGVERDPSEPDEEGVTEMGFAEGPNEDQTDAGTSEEIMITTTRTATQIQRRSRTELRTRNQAR